MRARRWAGACLSALLSCALLSGCGSEAPATDPSGDPSGAGSSSADPSGPTSAATGSTAVPPPGARVGPIASADLLVVAPERLAPLTVAKIRATAGVTGIAQTSMASISVEDRLLKVMAVDAGTYRNFTPATSADNAELWTRVAGGEVALDDSLRTEVAPDAEGYLELGAESGAPRLHVGAWAPQISGAVDAVVNTAWGRKLDMVEGNALLITTSSTAPDRVVKPLQKILGSQASIQRLDAVATYGLDIDAVQTAVVVGSVASAVGRYTYRVAEGGRVTPAASWVKSHISTQVVPILGSVTCNNALFPQLKAALADVVAQGLSDKIHPGEYAGCYYPRFIAGSHSLSNHAFGLALDFNVPGNGRGTVGEMDRSVVAIFKRWGFGWGGDWSYTDPMHFEMNRVVRPG